MTERTTTHLGHLGHEVTDLGTEVAGAPMNDPDFQAAVGDRVEAVRIDGAICACGTGTRISIAANKIRGIHRLAPHGVSGDRPKGRHGDAIVRRFGAQEATGYVAVAARDACVGATREPSGRNHRRIKEIADYERQYARA